MKESIGNGHVTDSFFLFSLKLEEVQFLETKNHRYHPERCTSKPLGYQDAH
jgi:hypothetical protein